MPLPDFWFVFNYLTLEPSYHARLCVAFLFQLLEVSNIVERK